MSGKEKNKLAASILIASLIAMIVGKVVDVLYKPNLNPSERGYQVAVSSEDSKIEDTIAPKEIEIDIKALMKNASAEAGKQLFAKCSACHTNTKGGPNRVGPNLWEVLDRVKAAHEGYNYSSVLKGLGGNWDYESLAKFLHKPMQYAKGTKMTFAGFNKQEDAANIIAYLRTLSDNPKALP